MHFSYICNYKDSWWTKTTKPHFSQNRVFTSLVVQLWLLFCSILGQLWLVALVRKLKTWAVTISLNCIILKLLWLVQRKTATTKNVLSVESRLDQTNIDKRFWSGIHVFVKIMFVSALHLELYILHLDLNDLMIVILMYVGESREFGRIDFYIAI